MFDVARQSAIGANIISRETIKALRKKCNWQNVMVVMFLGKRKLLEKQKAGKKE